MRKLRILGFFIASVAFGYYFHEEFGRATSIWLVVGMFGLVAVLKVIQLGLQPYVKALEAKMTPEELQQFEEYKRQKWGNDKTA